VTTSTPDIAAAADINQRERCHAEALALLRANTTAHGILAAGPSPQAERRNYRHVFGRDAAICALGMCVSGDEALRLGARAGLVTLAQYQAANGQIPKYVDIITSTADFWYLGCIDATLWWLIALRFYTRESGDASLQAELQPHVTRALTWLQCQEHPKLFLLQQNEASDWADIMPRSGFVLYSNTLWYYVKRLYDLPRQDATRDNFNYLFYPYGHAPPADRRARLLMHYVRNGMPRSELYLSFVNFSFWGGEGDVFGNLLAILFGLADEGAAHRIINSISAAGADAHQPIRVTCTPIAKEDILWRPYMRRHKQNLDYQYHNGGIWPFVGGFWVLALLATGQRQAAERALTQLARANAVDDWGFREWFHGATGTPAGMRGQSWNAAMFVLARWALTHKVF